MSDLLESEISSSSPEHKYALEQFIAKKNILISGYAGVGKSFLVRQLIQWCCDENKPVLVCGTTGQSALINQGSTLHSTVGLKPDEQDVPTILGKICNQLKAYESMDDSKTLEEKMLNSSWKRIHLLKNADVIFIDECSMLSAWFIELLDSIFRLVRNNAEICFGGIQVVLISDFRQLSPVPNKHLDGTTISKTDRFCFLSPVWSLLDIRVCELKKAFRQTDTPFIQLLEKIAMNQILSTDDNHLLDERMQSWTGEGNCVEIMIKNDAVRAVNARHYALVSKNSTERIFEFPSFESVLSECDDVLLDLKNNVKDCLQIDKRDPHPIQKLCVGSRVLLRTNIKTLDLVNGHTGTVIAFHHIVTAEGIDDEFPEVCFDHGVTHIIEPFSFERYEYAYVNGIYRSRCLARVCAIPLVLAWAMTVHKVQGVTIQCPVQIDCNGMNYMPATFYVALSRAKSLTQVYLTNYSKKFRAHDAAVRFYSTPSQKQNNITTDVCMKYDIDVQEKLQRSLQTNVRKRNKDDSTQCKKKSKYMK